MQGIWHAAKRRLRLLRYRLKPGVSFVHEATGDAMPSGVPLDPRRVRKILAFLVEEGLLVPRRVSQVLPASIANVRRVHTDRYLDSLADPEVLGGIFGVPVEAGDVDTILDVNRRMVGGTIQATRLALRTDYPAVHLGGGFHHAAPDRGMGFCVYNDIAIAIKRLRARGFQAPILVVDLDLHDGNGTRITFADDPSVFTFSIHNADWDDDRPGERCRGRAVSHYAAYRTPPGGGKPCARTGDLFGRGRSRIRRSDRRLAHHR